MTDAVKSLNPVSFQWKDDYKSNNSTKTQYGFIAQEVMQVLPDIVSETDDGTLAVNYVALIPILTATIQELTDRIEVLEERIKELHKMEKLYQEDIISGGYSQLCLARKKLVEPVKSQLFYTIKEKV